MRFKRKILHDRAGCFKRNSIKYSIIFILLDYFIEMKVIQMEIKKDSSSKNPIELSTLMYDLDRTRIQGEREEDFEQYLAEKDQNPQAGYCSALRQNLKEFWTKFDQCDDTEKLKYQQGLSNGTCVLNYIEKFAQKKIGFNPASSDEMKVQEYLDFKKSYKTASIAYQREDGSWGGLCMIQKKDTNEWVICNTKIEFKDGKLNGSVSIVGRGELFEFIAKNESINKLNPTELADIIENNDLSRNLVGFVSIDEMQVKMQKSPFKRFSAPPIQINLIDKVLSHQARSNSPISVVEIEDIDPSKTRGLRF